MNVIELIQELNSTDENHKIEAKRGSGVDTSFFESVCSFSNEPDLNGGFILLGLVRDETAMFPAYDIVGVDDPDAVAQQIASGCATRFNARVRPRVETVVIKGKKVIAVSVPELATAEKPLYFVNKKLPEGAFRRIGPTDQSCTEDDMLVFYGDKGGNTYDKIPMSDALMSDIDSEAVAHYRKLRERVRSDADELTWDDHDLLFSISAIGQIGDKWHPTVAGILLFGSKPALRRLFPMMRVDYIRVEGKEWVEDPDARFVTLDVRGPLLQTVQRIQTAIMDDLPKGFFLPEGRLQAENTVLSTRVLREAIVNAVMHRSYRVHGAVQIIRYSNRIEIINPGYSLKAEERLGDPGSDNRNPKLAAIFYDTNLAENKGSGIRAMRNLMKAARFAPPTFESDRRGNRFITRLLLQHFLTAKDLQWLHNFSDFNLNENQRKAMLFIRETGAIDNRSYRQFNSVDVYVATRDLRALREMELIEMKGVGINTYYVPGRQYDINAGNFDETIMSPLSSPGGEEMVTASYLPKGIKVHKGLVAQIDEIRTAGFARPSLMKQIIVELCSITTLSAIQLGDILNRKTPKLREKYLSPLVKERLLCYTMPSSPFNKGQAYRACI